jgi:hypothetical protein
MAVMNPSTARAGFFHHLLEHVGAPRPPDVLTVAAADRKDSPGLHGSRERRVGPAASPEDVDAMKEREGGVS